MFTRSIAIAAALMHGMFGNSTGVPANFLVAPRRLPMQRGKPKARRARMYYRGGGNDPASSGVGPRECERRRRQIDRGVLKPCARGLGA